MASFKNEKWKPVRLTGNSKLKYAVSNYGRIKSYNRDIKKGVVLKPQFTGGYPVLRFRIKKGRKIVNKGLFIRKLVAQYFLKRKSSAQQYVLLRDFNPNNNKASNLRWAGKKEMIEHNKKNPRVLKGLKNRKPSDDGHKLDINKVKQIKRMLSAKRGKLTNVQIAKKFRISKMTISRIKSGENWKRVKI